MYVKFHNSLASVVEYLKPNRPPSEGKSASRQVRFPVRTLLVFTILVFPHSRAVDHTGPL